MRRTTVLFVVCGLTLAVFFTGCKKNRPPAVPQLSGPTLGKPAATLTYTFSSSDPENQEIAYTVAWGDTSAVEWSSTYASGQQVTRTHSYPDSGVYHVKVKARDTQEAESEWSDSIVVSIGFRPPNQPGKPSGPASCTTGIAYTFTAKTTHPLGDSVWFQFDWSGAVGNWGGPVASDSQFLEQHVFDSVGTFGIMVRAKDARGGTSAWSEPLNISITRVEPPAKPVVSLTPLSEGAVLRLTWHPVQLADSYHVTIDGSAAKTTDTIFDVGSPARQISVCAYHATAKGDESYIDLTPVVSEGIAVYGISDPNQWDPCGFGFTTDGMCTVYMLTDANKPYVDFVADDQSISPIGLINAGDYGWPQNTKVNTLMDAGTTDFDGFDFAASTGYSTQLAIQIDHVYALWLSDSWQWTPYDHFCKMKVISMQNTGNAIKVTLEVGYQKVGGMRWFKTN